MDTSAIIFMVVVQFSVSLVTGYFFYRVLTTKKKTEPDSFSDNDDE